jgi:hypothetical protein
LFLQKDIQMTQTTQGTGPGSAASLKPPILNGIVKDHNISRNALDSYEGFISIDGSNEARPIGTITGDLSATGYVRGNAAGQLLNTAFYTFSNGVLTNASGTYTDFASVSYTPVSASSTLLIEYHATFAVNGGQGDGFRSRLTVGATEITWRSQTWADGQGGGTRSGVLFPISMVYTNSSVAAKTIKASANRASGDDTLSLDTTSAYLRISEYAR